MHVYRWCVGHDCDGLIDEEVRNACGTCGGIPMESCNGRDDDCDGLVDEDASCAGDRSCYAGDCRRACDVAGQCPAETETFCTDGVCVPWCIVHACADGERCTDRGCVDPCVDTVCASGEVCVAGECHPDHCAAIGCPTGERCTPSGCVADPCRDFDCGDRSFCREGECVFSCAEVSCPAASLCIDGLCADTGCGPAGCLDENQTCLDNVCVDAPCAGVACAAAEVCIAGVCTADPCLGIRCPVHQRCTIALGTAQCVANWPIRAVQPGPNPDSGSNAGASEDGGPPPPAAPDRRADAGLDASAADTGRRDPDAEIGPGGSTQPYFGCRTTGPRAGPDTGLWLGFLLLVAARRRRTAGPRG